MIKLKLSDETNMKCFSGLIHAKNILPDYSIELTTDSSYDFELIDSNQFFSTGMPFNDSISRGIENLQNKSGDYFLVHGGDSTSIAGVYEVFKQSNAKYLFKKQLLTREKYNDPSTIGKWFFGAGSKLDKSYNLSEEEYSKLMLTGYNVGHNWPTLHNLYDVNYNVKDIDVAAVYQTYIPKEVYDHEVRTDILYSNHREAAWKQLSKLPNRKIVAQQTDPNTMHQVLHRSKISISPYGMGELCYRDLESIQHGCIMIKPYMDFVITEPNLFIANETYIPCKVDYSDLPDIVENILGNYQDYLYIIENARKKLVESYSYNSVALYWYNFFANLSEVSHA